MAAMIDRDCRTVTGCRSTRSRRPGQPEAARRAGIRVPVCAAVTVTLAGAPQARGAARLVRVISSESHLAATVGGTAHAGRNQKLRRHAASRPAPLRRLSPASSERYQRTASYGGSSRIPATARTPHFTSLHRSWGPSFQRSFGGAARPAARQGTQRATRPGRAALSWREQNPLTANQRNGGRRLLDFGKSERDRGRSETLDL